MACYFNYFHFYTMLWNICGPVYIEKSVHFGTRRHIWIFVKFNIILILPPRTPKSLLILILLVSDWPYKMFVMVLKKLGDHSMISPLFSPYLPFLSLFLSLVVIAGLYASFLLGSHPYFFLSNLLFLFYLMSIWFSERTTFSFQ